MTRPTHTEQTVRERSLGPVTVRYKRDDHPGGSTFRALWVSVGRHRVDLVHEVTR